MKKLVQIVAGLNAAFQLVVGTLAVLSPATAAAAFQVEGGSPALRALVRMFGGLLAASGTVAALIARDPDRDRALARAFAACLLVNVAADVAVLAAGELGFGQLAGGMVLEAALAALLLAYRPLGAGALGAPSPAR